MTAKGVLKFIVACIFAAYSLSIIVEQLRRKME